MPSETFKDNKQFVKDLEEADRKYGLHHSEMKRR
jgi:hypothetical protein